MSRNVLKISRHVPSVFQGSLDFSGGRTFSLTIEHPLEPLLFRGLFGCLAFLLCLYLYFVTASVLNVIAREEASSRTAELQNSISHMEQNYFALLQDLKPQTGASLGLAPVSQTSYVHRPGATALADLPGQGQGAATIVHNDGI
ncbi:MAG: hypothetical protein UY74_C0026G0005 [Candidatus Kaiserbacteria bacterium GW2011_GWC2_52_8b]|uniref:Uncharacterized protein n=2 Tax=Candidatus Kaiseribacteriota TaxID=1752734 RepID=A0A0G1XIB2_9BACT|nr:MAG: hypothetical protein UY67_C0005G0005 [Candidatus Kaiserbacteria bacterium GW2011_GWA2_52_12]KKW30993.1 MAG: hypothetical protein UY74_C0026G0005 [Candidatus Kaiserbacteria bacterium GW2011_GWC2_52_8b]